MLLYVQPHSTLGNGLMARTG